ncbi:MAG: glycosyltransferase family 2 protein [Candidatus Coatesbacteria bacterium]|nr:glycosyltransferase family 2 protein [Candidatus Coatesbacteria bacterium]
MTDCNDRVAPNRRRPKVSVIVPVFNDEAHIARAIDSALSQTLEDVEVVVVNDGSTDGTAAILERYKDRIVVVTQENQGAGSSRNAGVRASCGEYLCFLDSDDRFSPNRAEIQARHLDRNPSVGLVYGVSSAVDSRDDRTIKAFRVESSPSDRSSGPFPPFYHTSAFLVRREWLERVGGFDGDMRWAMDTDLRFKLWAAGCKFMPHRDVVGLYTVRAGSLSGNPARQWEMHLEALKRHFDAMGAAVPSEVKNEHLATTWLRIACGRLIHGGVEQAIDGLRTAIGHEATLFERYESWALVIHYLDPAFPLPAPTWFPDFAEVWRRVDSLLSQSGEEHTSPLSLNERANRGALAFAISRRAFFKRRGLLARWWLSRALWLLKGRYPRDAHPRHFVQILIGPWLTNAAVRLLPTLRKVKGR